MLSRLRSPLATLLLAAAAARASAQATLVPSDAAPFQQKLDLSAGRAQLLLVPEPREIAGEAPFTLRFANDSLQALLARPGVVHYLTRRDDAFHFQLLHLRVREVPAGVLGAQEFEIADRNGLVVGRGRMLVVTRAPELVDVVALDGTRIFDLGRATPVRIQVRDNGNYAGDLRVPGGGRGDFELTDLAPPERDSLGILTIRATFRPLRREATTLRLAAETLDGNTAELTLAGLAVRMPAARRVSVTGGPVYLDAVGYGTATVSIGPVSGLASGAELAGDAEGELAVRDLRRDSTGAVQAQLEFAARAPRPAGSREVRELTVRVGTQEHRGRVEIVAGPTVSFARTEQGGARALITVGTEPTVLRITGQNLDELRVDCAPLGAGTSCRTIGTGPTELTTEVLPGDDVREGEYVLPLATTGGRRQPAGPIYPGGGLQVTVERPAVPVALRTNGLLALACAPVRGCARGRDGESLVARDEALRTLSLVLADSAIPAPHGWQRLVVTVTRVRGDQRQTLRAFGSPNAPRTFRRGSPALAIPLLETGDDLQHGDQVVVRVEHALEQYPAAVRGDAVAGEPWTRTVYVDGGQASRFSGDVSVQPVLYALSNGARARELVPLYMNAGIGATWQPMDWRMRPRRTSVKLQLLATSLADAAGEKGARQPALFLSGNLRVPGSDPGHPIVLTAGVARLLAGETGWRLLAGAGLDLGLSRLAIGR